MNIVTNIPFTDIILAGVAIIIVCWLLYRGFNPKHDNKSSSSKSKSSTKSKPSVPGININIGNNQNGSSDGDNKSN